MPLETYLDPLFEEVNCPLLTNLYESKEGILYEVFRVEADELWSFVGSRSNKQWLWMVMNTADRKIIAFQLGDRTINTAQQLLDKVPQMVKEKAVFSLIFG